MARARAAETAESVGDLSRIWLGKGMGLSVIHEPICVRLVMVMP